MPREDYAEEEPGVGNELYELSATGLHRVVLAPFEGRFVFDADPEINALLEERGMLLKQDTLSHSYPHCWRCKKPIIFRSTEQWFVSMDAQGLRDKALKSIRDVQWIPHWGEERIYSMIENRSGHGACRSWRSTATRAVKSCWTRR